MKFFITFISGLLISTSAALAGCCGYGCCDCSCIAVIQQQADLLERFEEITKGYGYTGSPIEITFPAETPEDAEQLLAMLSKNTHSLKTTNTVDEPHGLSCKIKGGGGKVWISCKLQ